MNKFLGVGKFLFTTLCVIFLTTGNSYAGWHELTQVERDQRILIQARGYNDGDFGGECKVWVAEVVRRAALLEGTDLTLGGTRQAIPRNQAYPNDFLWEYRSDVSGIVAPSLSSLASGQIIQMSIWYKLDHSKYGPHTLIITSNDTVNRKLNVIESNWTASNEVRRRQIPYDTFNQYLLFSGSYTVYWLR